MSTTTVKSSHVYGIGVMIIIVASMASIGYYQYFWLPESFSKAQVDEHILHPTKQTIIEIIEGSSSPDQQDNYVPKLVNIQLSLDNDVIWKNVDSTPHTVTPDSHDKSFIEDGYSGAFGSTGVIMPGEEYQFLFTEGMGNSEKVIDYHCDPHPWMKGSLVISKLRF